MQMRHETSTAGRAARPDVVGSVGMLSDVGALESAEVDAIAFAFSNQRRVVFVTVEATVFVSATVSTVRFDPVGKTERASKRRDTRLVGDRDTMPRASRDADRRAAAALEVDRSDVYTVMVEPHFVAFARDLPRTVHGSTVPPGALGELMHDGSH